MNSLAILLALSCGPYNIVNYTKTFNTHDKSTLEHAKIRCGKIDPEFPCLKTFIKKSDTNYNVICAKEIDNRQKNR